MISTWTIYWNLISTFHLMHCTTIEEILLGLFKDGIKFIFATYCIIVILLHVFILKWMGFACQYSNICKINVINVII